MKMKESRELFFELLLVNTGAKDSLSHLYTEEQWNDALMIAQEQSIDGVLLYALERLPDEQRPPQMVLLQWIGSVQLLEANSAKIAETSATVIKYFRDKGFACNILKGSAVASYYPQPERRTSGDVDVWLDGSRKKIYDFARKFDKDGKLYGVNYHHIHFHLIDDIPIEVHIWPSFLSSPLRNWRLHKFCNLHRPTIETDKPSLAFDRVFILLHCYMHMCGEGVGLRQIMDYYYVLKQGFTEKEKVETVNWIKKLGMEHFASGLMWVMQEVFGMKEEYLLCVPNEKEGRFILQEVMQTGNMGHSDTRNWGSQRTAFKRFIHNLRRDAYLFSHYPSEIAWQPFFSIWLYAWRWSKGLLGSEDND